MLGIGKNRENDGKSIMGSGNKIMPQDVTDILNKHCPECAPK